MANISSPSNVIVVVDELLPKLNSFISYLIELSDTSLLDNVTLVVAK